MELHDEHINIQENEQLQTFHKQIYDPEISKDTSHPTLPTVYNQ